MIDGADKTTRKRSIVLNLAIMVIVSIFISSGLAYFVALRIEDSLFAEEKVNQMKAVAQVIAFAVKNPLAAREVDRVAELVASVTENEQEIVHTAVFRADGAPVFRNGLDRENLKAIFDFVKKSGDFHGATMSHPDFMVNGKAYNLVASKIIVRYGPNEEKKRVSGYVALTFMRRPALEVERTRQAVILGTAAAKTTRSMLENYLFSEIKTILIDMKAGNPDVAYCYIIDPDSMVLIHPDEKMEGETLSDRLTRESQKVSRNRPIILQEYTDAKLGRLIDISFIIESGGVKLGVLRMGYSLGRLHKRIARLRLMIGLLVFFFITVSTVISVIISRRFARPILSLSEAARRIGAGELDMKVEVKTGGRELQILSASFNDMIKGLRERDLVKDTFSRYVTKQVADEILKYPDKIVPGGKKQEVTILFSDIRGFTTFSENNPPEEVVSHLNEYLSAMIDVIFKYEGTLDKFVGDAVMAVFGSPLPHADDPARAVRTALEMQTRLKRLNEGWTAAGRAALQIGIGINTGEVIVGNIGDVRRMEYTVIGDNVNLASRIEGLTKNLGCPIIISASTYEKVKDIVEVKPLESIAVKGKTKAVEIFELVGMKSEAQRRLN